MHYNTWSCPLYIHPVSDAIIRSKNGSWTTHGLTELSIRRSSDKDVTVAHSRMISTYLHGFADGINWLIKVITPRRCTVCHPRAFPCGTVCSPCVVQPTCVRVRGTMRGMVEWTFFKPKNRGRDGWPGSENLAGEGMAGLY